MPEVLKRSTSIVEGLEKLKQGMLLWKIRDKGVRGLKHFPRHYKLDMADLRITYLPNKHITAKNCTAGGAGGAAAIDLGDIAEVRFGHLSDNFNKLVKEGENNAVPKLEGINCAKDFCFSIIFKDDTPPLDLVTHDSVDRDLWVDVLNHLVVTMKSLGQQREYEIYLRKQFKNADKDESGCLHLDEVKTILENLNIKMEKDELKKRFDEANFLTGATEDSLNATEFVAFYYSLLKKPEIEEVFIKYATNNAAQSGPKMTPSNLMNFFTNEQKSELSPEECYQLIEAFEPMKDRSSLSIEGFTHFMMFSDHQDILDQSKVRLIYQNMDQPLSHYWIASSHNTYLLGNQLNSESSVDAYIRVLKEGCRCVELDCWDGEDGEPIIYHGWTLTSKILFKDVIADAIKEYAFYSTDYPLILSIENHCSLEQQDIMADHMTEILGDLLYTEPPNDEVSAMPSPEFLKGKVLVKAKRLPPGKGPDDEIEEDNYTQCDGGAESDVEDLPDAKKKEKPKKISQKLSDCVNYIHAVHFHGFSNPESKYYHMSSFGESKAFKFIEDPEKSLDFVKYNCRQISRIYPGAKRQDSSNLKVVPPWNAGCQIVALNYQTEDKQNFINRARFSDNGGCGYVLKPQFLRDYSISYSPNSPCGLDTNLYPVWKIEVKVISGQHIPKADDSDDIIDPYVKIRLRGHPDDEVDSDGEKINKGKTESVKNNGFNPVWNKTFNFESKVPSLAFLEFKVKDHKKSGKDEDIAMFCAPITLINEGYRRVPLKDYTGKVLTPAALMVHIKIEKNNYN